MAAVSDESTVMMQNELVRAYFMRTFTPGSTLTKDQHLDFTSKEITLIEELAKDLMWSSIERRGAISAGGTEVEEMFLQVEDAMPSAEMFDKAQATEEELQAVQSSIWARVTRLVADKGLTNGVEIMNLYDDAMKPYFGMTWLEASTEIASGAKIVEIQE